MGPEVRAILANPPAFSFETTFGNGRIQRSLGLAGKAILFGIETREMLAEYFRLLIPFETPGSGIPAGDDAIGIDHVDRIVHHRIDQQSQTAVLDRIGFGSITAH